MYGKTPDLKTAKLPCHTSRKAPIPDCPTQGWIPEQQGLEGGYSRIRLQGTLISRACFREIHTHSETSLARRSTFTDSANHGLQLFSILFGREALEI